MRTLYLLMGLFAALSIMPETALAQKATEIYIPVSQSPGLSEHYTWHGTIESVDIENLIITVSNTSGTRDINLSTETKIWLDRSKTQQTNQVGDFDDCQPGLTVEVKYRENKIDGEAEWVKISVTG